MLTIDALIQESKLPDSILDIRLFWRTYCYRLGGEVYSLHEIGDGLVRGECHKICRHINTMNRVSHYFQLFYFRL